jgi:hypothetical protein
MGAYCVLSIMTFDFGQGRTIRIRVGETLGRGREPCRLLKGHNIEYIV